MKHPLTLIILLLSIVWSSCDKDKETNIITSGDLVGCWINPQYTDSTIVYDRATDFNDGPGILFNNDNSLIEKKNAGFCGTPPVTYAEYDGSYTVNDSIISVSVGDWSGTLNYSLELISLDGEKLTVKWLSSNK